MNPDSRVSPNIKLLIRSSRDNKQGLISPRLFIDLTILWRRSPKVLQSISRDFQFRYYSAHVNSNSSTPIQTLFIWRVSKNFIVWALQMVEENLEIWRTCRQDSSLQTCEVKSTLFSNSTTKIFRCHNYFWTTYNIGMS